MLPTSTPNLKPLTDFVNMSTCHPKRTFLSDLKYTYLPKGFTMGKGSGFGKVILLGEHFVVHGVPGIVSAIDSTNDAEVKKTTKGITSQ